MSWDKSGDPRILRRWFGDMEVKKHIYTMGIAGEIFMKNLKDKGVITGSRCDECEVIFVPPRSFCEYCFSELTVYEELEPKGYIETFTIVYEDYHGERLEKPLIIALIALPNAVGGIIHYIREVEPEDVYIDMEVEAVLKPRDERAGNLSDILYFKPT
jgi:hypothetical protein